MLVRRTEKLNAADLRAIDEMRASARTGAWVRPIACLALGAAAAAGGFAIVRLPDAGALVFVAMSLVLLGCALCGYAVFLLICALPEWREESSHRAQLRAARERGDVEIIEVECDAAWVVPAIDDTALLLLRTSPSEFIVATWSEHDSADVAPAVPTGFTLRVLPGVDLHVLSVNPRAHASQVEPRNDLPSVDGDIEALLAGCKPLELIPIVAFPERSREVLTR